MHNMDTDWKEELLSGLTCVPTCGVPGRVVVYGSSAKPILTGVNEEDVLMAAAQLDKGRVVVFPHDGYATNFEELGLSDVDELRKLQRNVKLWVSGEKFDGDESILNAKCTANKDKLNSCKIVIWAGGAGEIPTSDVLEFIRNGGGFVHCMAPWGWLQLNPGRKLKDMPYWDVLTSVGVCYTDDYINVDESGFWVKENKASNAHLLDCLQSTDEQLDNILMKMSLVKDIQYLPDDVKESVKCFITPHWDKCTTKLQCTFQTDEMGLQATEQCCLQKLWLLCAEFCSKSDIKAPGIGKFPGDFIDTPFLTSSSMLTFESEREDIHPTGCYAPAGKEVTVRVLSGNETGDWQVIIGAHTDNLGGDLLRRWPIISKEIALDQQGSAEYKVSSYFGGSIYFLSSNNGKSSLNCSTL